MRKVFIPIFILAFIFLFQSLTAQKVFADERLSSPSLINEGQSFLVHYSDLSLNTCYAFRLKNINTGQYITAPLISILNPCISGYYGSFRSVRTEDDYRIDGLSEGEYELALIKQECFGLCVLPVKFQINFTVKKDPLAPHVSVIVCVYSKGTPVLPSPPPKGCSSSGSFEDTFIASGYIRNVLNPGSTLVSFSYSTDFRTFLPLTSTFPDSNGFFSRDISNDIQKVKSTTSTTGLLYLRASINVGGSEYSSSNIDFSITSLSRVTPAPTYPQGTPFQPDCEPVDKNDLSKGYKFCRTAIGEIPTNPAGLVSFLLKFILGLSGGIALLLIIFSGYRMATAAGNPEALQGARETLTSAIVGLVFIILAIVILRIIGVEILAIPGFGP